MTRRQPGRTWPAQIRTVNRTAGTAAIYVPDYQGVVTARLAATARNVKAGDTVVVTKPGGVWWVQHRTTHTPPTPITGSVGSRPADARTVGAGSVPSVRARPTAPNSNPGSTLYSHELFLINTKAHLEELERWTADVTNAVRALTTQVAALRDAINTNATRTNQVRNYAGTAADLAEQGAGILEDEGLA